MNPLSPDQSTALLHSFVRGTLSLPDLADSAGISLPDLLHWAQSPEIAPLLDALEALALRHARLAAAIAAPAAIQLLDQLVQTQAAEDCNPPTDDPPANVSKAQTHRRLSRELARKSANAIIAQTKPPRPKKTMRTADPAPEARASPDPTPQTLALELLTALAARDPELLQEALGSDFNKLVLNTGINPPLETHSAAGSPGSQPMLQPSPH